MLLRPLLKQRVVILFLLALTTSLNSTEQTPMPAMPPIRDPHALALLDKTLAALSATGLQPNSALRITGTVEPQDDSTSEGARVVTTFSSEYLPMKDGYAFRHEYNSASGTRVAVSGNTNGPNGSKRRPSMGLLYKHILDQPDLVPLSLLARVRANSDMSVHFGQIGLQPNASVLYLTTSTAPRGLGQHTAKRYWEIDAATHLPIATTVCIPLVSNSCAIRRTTRYADYATLSGITTPTTVTTNTAPTRSEVFKVTALDIGLDLPTSRFGEGSSDAQ